jgi:ferrochelatase
MKKAVVLLNMGGPSNLGEVRVFLKNMFADPNILTVKSSALRWLIGTIIVLTRTKNAQSHYALIGGSSPLLPLTEKLAAKLSSLMDEKVYIAMRYVPPFSKEAVRAMMEDEVQEVVLLPMYPHYSTTTTKSSIEDFYKATLEMGYHPKVHTIERFYKKRAFNELIVEKIKESLAGEDAEDFDLVFSAHSLPQKIIDAGDSYEKEIEEHVQILEGLLYSEGVHFRKTHLAYQSKLGPMKWIGPSLGDMLTKISASNKKVLVYPIAFTVDNVETAYELDIEYREIAEGLKIEEYRVVSCPNDSEDFARALAEIIDEKMGTE